jgi:O-acetyl-ADP-ribose deacetylase (regulator of RNase III)
MRASQPILSAAELASVVDDLRRALGDEAIAAPEIARRRLREALTVQTPGSIPETAWPLLEALWATEATRCATTRATSLPRLATSGWAARVSFWRGDITTLEIDAIVNAANSGLTGCYRPFHACVDNAIHTAAGPWLREECGQLMAARGRPEPTSTATVTLGYFLPARHVVHTVGPIVEEREPTRDDEDALRRCYSECMKAVAALPEARAIAFCGISTGVFGYPTRLAAPAALSTVRDLLERDPRLEQVVFVTYSESDEAGYLTASREALRE